MRRFLIALQFLTIVPIDLKEDIRKEDFGLSLLYFPAVGLLIGLLLALGAYCCASVPILVKSALILIIWIIATGGIHLDAFADTCDGFYGKRSREEILRIMRDSRIGTMGAAGVAMLLIFKFAMLASIYTEDLWKVLMMAAVFARWAQVFVCAASKYAREEGKAEYFIKYAKKTDALTSALFTLVLFSLLMGLKGIMLFVLSLITVVLFMQYVKSKIGGMTGDTIGAANEIAEAATLLFGLFVHIPIKL